MPGKLSVCNKRSDCPKMDCPCRAPHESGPDCLDRIYYFEIGSADFKRCNYSDCWNIADVKFNGWSE